MATTTQPERVHLRIDGKWYCEEPAVAERLLSARPTRECPRCRGRGKAEMRGVEERCAQCQGLGKVLA